MDVDWRELFDPSTPLIETFIRGTVTYLSLFFLLRFIARREAASVSITDLLVIVLIADAAQNAMADEYKSVTDGIILVATIIFWNLALDWLGYRVPLVGQLVHPAPLELIRDGQEIRRNMAREFVTHEELMSHLRSVGIEDISRVKRAYIEGNGHISVLERKS
jgi:uncharacterized membrane protein YcaP (DUF421 family)